jgi:hypothetical protein
MMENTPNSQAYTGVQLDMISMFVCEANRAACEAHGDFSQVPWKDASNDSKASAISGVTAKINTPSMTPVDQHEEWMCTKFNQGWTFGPEKDADKKTHPCLVPYAALPAAQQAKDAIFADTVMACVKVLDTSMRADPYVKPQVGQDMMARTWAVIKSHLPPEAGTPELENAFKARCEPFVNTCPRIPLASPTGSHANL